MRVRRSASGLALLLGCVIMVAPVGANAASNPRGTMASETLVLVPGRSWVHTLVVVVWARRPAGRREFIALPQGFTTVEDARPNAVVTSTRSGVWVEGRPRSLTLHVIAPATAPFLLDETTAAPIQRVTLFTAGEAYPSGNALGPFAYQGVARLAGRELRVFAAENVPAGTQIFIPVTFSNPVPAARRGLDVALGAMAVGFLLGAAWWALRRFGGQASALPLGGPRL